MEFTLLGAAAIGVSALYGMLRWEAKRGSVLQCSRDLWDLALTGLVFGVFAGRVVAMVADGVNPITSPADILIVRAGVSTGAATVAAIATVAWLGRRELWQVLDGLAAPTLAGLAGWHAGCLAREACLGSITGVPWAMTLDGSGVGRHPVELYAAALFAVAAIGLALWRKRSLPPLGVSAGIALAAAGSVRLATQPMRPALSAGPVGWYLAAVLTGIVVIALYHRRAPTPAQS